MTEPSSQPPSDTPDPGLKEEARRVLESRDSQQEARRLLETQEARQLIEARENAQEARRLLQTREARQLLESRARTQLHNRILIVVTLLAVAGMVLMYVVGLKAEIERDDQIDRLGRCVAEQLAEHRRANEAAHKALADALDVPYKPPVEHLPSPAPDHLLEYCDEFAR